MKTRVFLTRVDPTAVDPATIQDAERILPPRSKFTASVSWEAYEDDPRMIALRERLRVAGLTPYRGRGQLKEPAVMYMLDRRREYDQADLDKEDYLRPVPTRTEIGLFDRDHHGRIGLALGKFRKSLKTLRKFDLVTDQFRQRYLIPDRVKRILERFQGVGVAFRPTVLDESRSPAMKILISWDDVGDEIRSEPWWELTSNLLMPAVSADQELVDWKSQPVTIRSPLPEKGVRFVEGDYTEAELEYDRDSIATMMPKEFDLARTNEALAPDPQDDQRLLIASNRFYKFWLENNLKCEWVPVRVQDR